MQDKEKPSMQQGAVDIAREAFRRLAARRIAPTPDAYRDVYQEIAGARPAFGPDQLLADFAAELASAPDETAECAARLRHALEAKDWQACGDHLRLLAERHLKRTSALPVAATAALATEPAALIETVPDESQSSRMLRDLLIRTLTLAVGSLLQGSPELAKESESLADAARKAVGERALDEIGARLKQLCFKIDLRSEDMAEEHEMLLRLFKLLLENIGELLEDDSWLSGQIASVQDLLSGPLSHGALNAATRSLKEVIYKQGMLKHSLAEAKITVKNMMLTFIDRLGTIASSTADYHEKIDKYSQQIGKARDIVELNQVLDELMRDTRIAQTEALRSRDEMITARQDVQDAEARIRDLESRLEQMSELVREDQLTGSLNRRGLDDVLEREMARAARRKSPLCIAMLDLDDFKRLNDTHGHNAGDEALIHLVNVVKATLRTMDVVARFGGEEFLIVLPDTPLENALQVVTRLQHELTRRIFMYNNQHLLMTFSAGVALREPGEDRASLIKRADAALYEAKKAGKNRVVAADRHSF